MEVSRSSSPKPKPAKRSRYSLRSLLLIPCLKPLLSPLRKASARFSSIPIVAAVPFIGSWNTLPRKAALLNSGSFVTSLPSMRICPSSTSQTPAMALSNVDFPAPFPPITVTKSPFFSVRLRSFSACFSLTVPGLNVFEMCFISSISSYLPFLWALRNTGFSIQGLPGIPPLPERRAASANLYRFLSRLPPEAPDNK